MRRTPLNTSDIEQALLNIERKERSNPLPWNGQFSPQLVEVLLGTYAPTNSVVFDPFAGSGTLLYEAGRRNLQAAAADINPAAYYLARTYTTINQKPSTRKCFVADLDEALHRYFPARLPLFARSNRTQSTNEEPAIRLLKVRDALRDPNARMLLESLLVMADFCSNTSSTKSLFATWTKLRSVVEAFPYSAQPIEVFNRDARQVPLKDHAIDLVITSPPYVNVFNYHQRNRSSVEALGWDVLTVAKSEIGSNRKHRGNRFLTVVQYCLDISQVFDELRRVCKQRARIIFVVGRESRVLGTPFYNGDIIGLVGTRCAGFELLTRQERVFRNKYGECIYEDILHFTPALERPKDPLERARAVARKSLHKALKVAPQRAVTHMKEAIARVPNVEPSQLYSQEASMTSSSQPLRRKL